MLRQYLVPNAIINAVEKLIVSCSTAVNIQLIHLAVISCLTSVFSSSITYWKVEYEHTGNECPHAKFFARSVCTHVHTKTSNVRSEPLATKIKSHYSWEPMRPVGTCRWGRIFVRFNITNGLPFTMQFQSMFLMQESLSLTIQRLSTDHS